MKIIIAIAFSAFSFLVTQAQIKIKVIDAQGIERWIDYVPGVTNVTGVPKSYVDSAVGNKSLQSYLLNSIANLQNQYAAKLHRHNASDIDNLPTGTGSSFGNIINLPSGISSFEYRPIDYGINYSDGSVQSMYRGFGYGHATGINDDGRPDNVVHVLMYNMDSSGNRIYQNEAAFRFGGIETHYKIPGYGASVEPHVFLLVDRNGVGHRNLSGYFSKEDGRGFWSMETNYLSLTLPTKSNQINPVEFAKITDAAISLTASEIGKVVGYTATDYDGTLTGIWNVGGVGFLKIPQVADLDGYDGHKQTFLPNLKTYASNAEAKAAGLTAGNVYWTRINGIKILAQVE